MSRHHPLNSSTSDLDISSSSEDSHLRNFANHMLKGKLFVGTYCEKRYVEALGTYRDVVMVNGSEKDFISNLSVVQKRIASQLGSSKWLGITQHSNTIKLWVTLSDQVLGSYWYTVKSVKFKESEIYVQLTKMRPVEELQDEIRDAEFSLNLTTTQEVFLQRAKEWLAQIYQLMTLENAKSTAIFISILLVTLVTGVVNILRFLIIHGLAFMREISIFVHSITPFMQSVLALIERVIGWFFVFFAMIWKDVRKPAQPKYYQPIGYSTSNMIDYRPKKSSVTIKEIEY